MHEMRRTPVGLLALLTLVAVLTGGVRRTEGVAAVDTPAESAAGAESTRRPNRLVHETSPYLRLHAYNPVDWYPWGAEALERAKREQKPIFLSVGYSTCYWCHVMEREVFEHPELAEMMNRWFVNIKVDREERPELDEIYMTATQILTGRGGWPNSVFLTPDLEPFFAGTYFPPEDQDRRPGFRRVLTALQQLWANDRERVESEAEQIAEAIRGSLAQQSGTSREAPGPEASARAVEELAERYDETWGGFGTAPKFPSPANLYLLWHRAEAGDEAAKQMVLDTLRKMGRGAIYDQLDGGFHRYTLDAAWRVPHFEKMLYDNAHLGELLAVTAAATGDAELERLARGTFDFVLDWMRLPSGAYKSAIDAETDAVEGAYYIWTREEFRDAVGEDGYRLLAPIFGIDGEPNFEDGHYTLFLTRSLEQWAAELELEREELLAAMAPHLDALRKARGEREFPLVDDKVLTDWNGMMIGALAHAGSALGEPRYVRAAERAAEVVLKLRDADGVLLHAFHEGQARIEAFLDDYAFLTRALLTLHEVTGAERWLESARELTEQLETRLRAPLGGYYTSAARPDLLLQVVSATDGAIPAGNGVAVRNLLELAERTDRAAYRERADAALRAFAGDLDRWPRAVTTLALAVLEREGGGIGVRGEPSPDNPGIGIKGEPSPDNPSIGTRGEVSPDNPGIGIEGEASPDDTTGGGAGGAGLGGVGNLAREVVEVTGVFVGAAGEDGARPFRVELAIRDGWHVNANPASLEFLIPTRVGEGTRDVRYPPGERFRFEFAPEEISVYSGVTGIVGRVEAGRTELELTYQACDDRRCLPPVTETVPLGD